MKVKFLGTGTSTGVPEIGCECEICRSEDKRDKRLRSSVLITINDKHILIDCGPDFRQQLLQEQFAKIDGLLLTHEHYDHVGGLDDLRPYSRFGDVEIYTKERVGRILKERIPYCFAETKYPGVPNLNLNLLKDDSPFYVEGIEIVPIQLMHYKLSIFGYRIGNFAYLTDLKSIPDEEYKKLEGLDVLVMNALRIKEHISHQTLDEALENVKRIAPRKAYLIHMSHQIGLHAEVEKLLPENVHLSYDGLEIEL